MVWASTTQPCEGLNHDGREAHVKEPVWTHAKWMEPAWQLYVHGQQNPWERTAGHLERETHFKARVQAPWAGGAVRDQRTQARGRPEHWRLTGTGQRESHGACRR